MKVYLTTHSDGTTSLSTRIDMVVKPQDAPSVVEYDLPESDAQMLLDDPTAYSIVNGEVVKN